DALVSRLDPDAAAGALGHAGLRSIPMRSDPPDHIAMRDRRRACIWPDFPGSVWGMRLGVLDVGSNTVHLLVVDAHQGARPVPAFSHKGELRLGDHLDAENRLTQDCALQLRDFVDDALRIAEDKGVQELLAFATSAVRDAANGDEVLAWIQGETQVDIRVLPGPDESRLTFLAARRWFGWSSGRLLMLDIGGGSLELAAGLDEEPDAVLSLPLGAGRL